QCLVEVAPLAFELLDAFADPLESASILRRAGRIGLVQAEILADGLDRKPEPSQSLDQDEARAILIVEDAGATHARGRDQPALLVESNALRRQRELLGELGDAVEARPVGRP